MYKLFYLNIDFWYIIKYYYRFIYTKPPPKKLGFIDALDGCHFTNPTVV
jgi:hypothetical protein